MVFVSLDINAAHGDTGGVGGVPELAGYCGDFTSYSRSEWVCSGAVGTGAVVYVLCVWADIFLISST